MTAPDRIVVINDQSRPVGGASVLAVQSAIGLARRGHAVTFLSGDRPSPHGIGHPGVTAIGLGEQGLLARGAFDAMLRGWWNHAAWRLVREWIAAHDTPGTVYHLHGWSQILSPAVLSALAPVRDRLVISAHDFFLVCPNGAFADLPSGKPCKRVPLGASCIAAPCDRRGRLHKAWRLGRGAIQRAAMPPRHSPLVLAIHAAMRPLLQRGGIPAEAIHVVPNPVVAWSPTRIAAETNREVLFVGRIEATKGADLALGAARAAGVPIRLVGDGALLDRLRAEYPEAHFTGWLDHQAILDLAQHARLLVMPSRYPEPFGLVAMEALRSGLPVVLPPSALLAEDIARIGAGVTVEPRDTPGFAAVLRQLAGDDAAIATMSHAGFAQSDRLALDPQAWLDRLVDAYVSRLEAAAMRRALPSMFVRAAEPCPTAQQLHHAAPG
jgi:glycosyltransferase involved in cell wall biosynthesis